MWPLCGYAALLEGSYYPAPYRCQRHRHQCRVNNAHQAIKGSKILLYSHAREKDLVESRIKRTSLWASNTRTHTHTHLPACIHPCIPDLQPNWHRTVKQKRPRRCRSSAQMGTLISQKEPLRLRKDHGENGGWTRQQ